jgi:integrase
LDEHTDSTVIRAQLTLEWVRGTTGNRGPSRQAGLLSLARGFLTYLKASYPETEIPGRNLIAAWRRPTPYIFSTSEINRLLDEAAKLGRHHSMGRHRELRHHTYEILLGLLACTGIRVSEAQNLLVSDVYLDDTPSRLLIRESKFDKSRWVPLHPTATERLCHYAKLRNARGRGQLSEPFFISQQGEKLKYAVLYWTFQNLLELAAISPQSGQRRPTLHSFRHYFAVHRLRTWYETGKDARLMAPHLSVYLGHVNLADTYWYLTATPELLGAAASLFDGYFSQGGVQ